MPRPLLPSELPPITYRPEPDTSISARVRADLREEPVDLAKAATLAQRIVSRRGASAEDAILQVPAWESHYLARAVLRQGALLDKYEVRLAELAEGLARR